MSEYMRELIEAEWPQFILLNRRRFETYLRVRDIEMSQRDLEHFERIGFLYPVLRLHRSKTRESGPQRYVGVNESAYALKKYLEQGRLEFPSPSNFRPWKEYRDGYEEKTFIYYHPYQLLLIDRFLQPSEVVFKSIFFENAIDVKRKTVTKEALYKHFVMLNRHHEQFKRIFLGARPQLIRKIGLLLRLQNAYQPSYRNRFHLSPYDNKSLQKWHRWKTEKFSTKSVLEKCNFSIEEVKEWRNYLAALAAMKDPMRSWYRLVRLVHYDKKEKLRGKTLLAQDYYEMVGILNYFLQDLTGEKQLEPDDIVDGRHGEWKERFYGKKFSYEDPEIRRKIVEEHLAIPPPAKVILLVEGDTEEVAIPILADAMGINFERIGIRIRNFEGVGGIHISNISQVLQFAASEGVGSYLIVDNEEDVAQLVADLKEYLDTDCYRIWVGDFEEDNFGEDAVLEYVNDKISSVGLDKIEKRELEREMRERKKKKNLMRAIKDLFWKKYGDDVYRYISKTELARSLSQKRAHEIEKEIAAGSYVPKWEIEKEIVKICKKFRL